MIPPSAKPLRLGAPGCDDARRSLDEVRIIKETTSQEVEFFLQSNGIDPAASKELRSELPYVAWAVMERGPLLNCTNSSRALVARIRDAKRMGIQMVGGGQGPGGQGGQGDGKGFGVFAPLPENATELDKFLHENRIDQAASSSLKSEPDDFQKQVMSMGTLINSTNPSASLIARIKTVKNRGPGMGGPGMGGPGMYGGGGGMFMSAGPASFGMQPGGGLNSCGLGPGDRVFEPNYGEGTVEAFITHGEWAGKLKVKLDKDGFSYHIIPDGCRKIGAAAPDMGAEALKAIQNLTGSGVVGQSGGCEFNPGDRISEPEYGEGTVEAFMTSGDWAGKLKAKFDKSGFSYHVEPSNCMKLGGSAGPAPQLASPDISAEALRASQNLNDEQGSKLEGGVESCGVSVGDRVSEPEYGVGTVEAVITSGDWAGKLRVKMDRDGFSYHVLPETCRKVGTTAPDIAGEPLQAIQNLNGNGDVGQSGGCVFNVGDRISEPEYGEGTVEAVVTSGEWAGKLKVKVDKDGFSYHFASEHCTKVGGGDALDLGTTGEPPAKVQKMEDMPFVKMEDVPFVS